MALENLITSWALSNPYLATLSYPCSPPQGEASHGTTLTNFPYTELILLN